MLPYCRSLWQKPTQEGCSAAKRASKASSCRQAGGIGRQHSGGQESSQHREVQVAVRDAGTARPSSDRRGQLPTSCRRLPRLSICSSAAHRS